MFKNNYRLTHIANSETSQGREFLERLNAQRLRWDEDDNCSVSRLDGLGILLGSFSGTTIAFLFDLREFAGNMRSMAIEYWRVTVGNLAWMVQYNDLRENEKKIVCQTLIIIKRII